MEIPSLIIVVLLGTSISGDKMSYVVSSDPYCIQPCENVQKLQRDFNHDNTGENEISEVGENMQNECESNGSCNPSNLRAALNDATFRPFPQDELEKILKKYGKHELTDRLSNLKLKPTSSSNEISSSLSFQPVTTENSFDTSKSWSLVNAQSNGGESNPNRVGWVTLEPVAWSTSQIQQWKPSMDSVPTKNENPSWSNPVSSKPQIESQGWNSGKQPWHSAKPTPANLKPDYTFEKPSNNYDESHYEPMKYNMYDPLKPTYDPLKPIYDSLKPTYDPIEPTHQNIKASYDSMKPTYNPIKPTLEALGLTYDSSPSMKPNFDFVQNPYWKPNKIYDSKPTSTNIKPTWNAPVSTEPIMSQIITPQNQEQFAHYMHPNNHPHNNIDYTYMQQSIQQQPDKQWGTSGHNANQILNLENPFPPKPNIGRPAENAGDGEGHWVLLSSTKEYSGHGRQADVSRSLKDKELYRNVIPLTITGFNGDHGQKFGRTLNYSEGYKRYFPLKNVSDDNSVFKRKSIPLIITADSFQKQSNRSERKLDLPSSPSSVTNFQEPNDTSRTARRMVKLTVLPRLNGSHTVTSHNGMIEVEDTKMTVDESHREHLARTMNFQNKKADQDNNIAETVQQDHQNSKLSGQHRSPKTTILLPIVIGKRRRRYEANHHNQNNDYYNSYYPRQIITATQ